MLNRLHNEGLQVLTLSDLRYLRQQTSPRPDVQDGTDVRTLQDAWEAEKHALLDAIQALKDLISEANKGQWVSQNLQIFGGLYKPQDNYISQCQCNGRLWNTRWQQTYQVKYLRSVVLSDRTLPTRTMECPGEFAAT